MLAGQTIVFILILYSVMAIEADSEETASKADNASRLSAMDMSSENVMLDCCFRLHGWVRASLEPTAEGIFSEAEVWGGEVSEYLHSTGLDCTIALEDVVVEPLTNQTFDPLQMGFLGERGDERWHVSAMLKVWLFSGSLSTTAAYQISIIA